MTSQEFHALKKGDKIFFNEKPEQLWAVDYPITCSTKKAWKQMGGTAEPTSAGGGVCECGQCCITISTETPNGEGSDRMTITISNYESWTKK